MDSWNQTAPGKQRTTEVTERVVIGVVLHVEAVGPGPREDEKWLEPPDRARRESYRGGAE